MNKFLVIYNAPASAMAKMSTATPEEKMAGMKVWMDWKQEMGDAVQNLNFGGQHKELWSEGGEIAFLTNMAKESQDFAEHVGWSTTLVSKSENIKPLQLLLKQLDVTQMRIIEMSQGQKNTRILAWRFDTDDE